MHWTDLHHIVNVGTYMGGHDQSDLLFRSLKGCFYGNQFWARIGENWHILPSFFALAFNNGREDLTTDAGVNTADDPSTSDKNLVNFGPVFIDFCNTIRNDTIYSSQITCAQKLTK